MTTISAIILVTANGEICSRGLTAQLGKSYPEKALSEISISPFVVVWSSGK